jgi:hypothetical protein
MHSAGNMGTGQQAEAAGNYGFSAHHPHHALHVVSWAADITIETQAAFCLVMYELKVLPLSH